jgi:Tol biopolymer transport system component
VARQLARGLEFAHERGIVHRDLKPANIKLGGDGRVKILDFGLARAFTGVVDGSSTSTPAMTQATMPQDLTRPGTVLGTAAYMSPEQARGYDVDRRTDIWAFGVILFEMLTGQKLFSGETSSDTLAAILRQDPDYDALPETTPPVLVQIIRRCLAKDPQQRLRDVGEVRIALEDGSSSVVSMGSSASGVAINPALDTPRRSPLAWILVAVLAVILGGVLTMGLTGRMGPAPQPPRLIHAQVGLPDRTTFYLNPAQPGPPIVSPDGRHLAFAGLDSTGRVMLFVRSLDQQEARSIPGTQGAGYPFWAPNSREIGFFSDNDLNRVDIAGGPVVSVCTAENGKGGSWNADDMILFAPTHVASIHLVPAGGGQPVPVTTVDADSVARSHRFPSWLPDSRHFIYLSWRNAEAARETGNETVLRLGSIDGSTDRELLVSQTNGQFVDGHILHVHEANLMARPFSVSSLEITGPPRPVLGGVLSLNAAHVGVFSASEAGLLGYVAGDGVFGLSRLTWFSPGGDEMGTLPEAITVPQGISVSPDGRRIAVSRADDRAGTFDIWIYEKGRDVGARFTFESETEVNPIWSSDGEWITYSGTTHGGNSIFIKPANGAGRPRQIADLEGSLFPSSWSQDDRRLLLTWVRNTGQFDIWMLDRDQPDSLRAWRETPFNEGNATFSPDDRWIAYTSDETGTLEIFVESALGDGARYRISSNSGVHPRWAPDGDRLYYLDTTGNLMATAVEDRGGALVVGETVSVANGLEIGLRASYAVDPISGDLLIQRPLQDRVSDQLQLVMGWQNLLQRDR